MDAVQLLEEYQLAQEEHARALAEVEQMRQRVEAARAEAEHARATERKYERDMEVAAAKLAEGLSSLRVEDVLGDAAPSALPPVSDYLVEYHANIGCYHCYLIVGGDGRSAVDTSVLSVSVELTKVALLSAAGEWWSVELERKVDAENCAITAKDDHIYVRLPVSPSDKETVDGFSSFSQTSPEELHVESYSTLSCRGCGAVFVDDAKASLLDKVLPLPSENWMEMFDFWGAGIGSFEHIPREGIVAHEHRVFVGESNIILHENDFTGKAVVVDAAPKPVDETRREDEELPEWTKVCCAACNVTIGDRRAENPFTLRLQKHLLAARGRDAAQRNVFERYTIDSTISAQMLHVAESDGVFRFILKAPSGDSDSSSSSFAGLQLQLLSWDAKVCGSASGLSASEFRRVLKVVYTTGPGAAVSPVAAVQAELPPMLRTHELVVTPAIGCEILARLERSTRLLPESQRSFNKMTVGYLYA